MVERKFTTGTWVFSILDTFSHVNNNNLLLHSVSPRTDQISRKIRTVEKNVSNEIPTIWEVDVLCSCVFHLEMILKPLMMNSAKGTSLF